MFSFYFINGSGALSERNESKGEKCYLDTVY